MRTTIAVSSLLCGLAMASPMAVKRQDLPISEYELVATAIEATGAPVGNAVPQTTDAYNPTKVASAVVSQVTDGAASTDTAAAVTVGGLGRRGLDKRATCTTRTFNGPQVTDPADSPAAFQSYAPFASAALGAPVPSGYGIVPGFLNLLATAQDPSYLTYVSSRLTTYDPSKCAALCDAMSGCTSFNIYFERVPLVVSDVTQVPDSNLCPATSTSPSATLIKCAFYGMPVVASEATNIGQFQGGFKVVIAGSNAYAKATGPVLPGYEGPVSFGNATINAPAPVIDHGYLRAQTFGTNVPFDPSLCAASCAAQTAYNAQHGTFGGQACIFINAYILYKNGENGVFTCAYYGVSYDASYATNVGQWNNQGDHWTIGSSYGYYLI